MKPERWPTITGVFVLLSYLTGVAVGFYGYHLDVLPGWRLVGYIVGILAAILIAYPRLKKMAAKPL